MLARLTRPRPLISGGVAILFGSAILLGGGGAEGYAQNGLIAALGAFALALFLSDSWRHRRPISPRGTIPRLLGFSLLALLLIQLIPMPPSWWHQLPGREAVVEALTLIGTAQSWRPLSIDPAATWRSVTFVLLPLAVYFYALDSDRTAHLRLMKSLAASAGLSALIGAAQLALGHPEWLSFYDGPSVGSASGIFANPNHQALLMAFGLVACAILIRENGPARKRAERSNVTSVLSWAGIALFPLMILASGSRAGLMLLALALPGSLLLAKGSQSLMRGAGALIAAVAVLWMVILLYPGTNSLAVRESFRLGEDARYAYLPDIFYTLQQYWASGSGIGSFVTVIAPNENLDIAQRGYLNHAHNDFLEWLIETGLPGLIWLGLGTGIVAYFAFSKLRQAKEDTALTLGACLMIILTALHSLADYPMRTVSIAASVALALGIICSLPRKGEQTEKTRGLWVVLTAILIAAPIAAQSLRLNLAQSAERENNLPLQARLAPESPDVLIERSAEALERRQFALAEALAVRAVNAEPLNPAAVRQFALALDGQKRSSGKVWQFASSLGWRDAPTQYWAFSQAVLENEPEIAALRADALLRTSNRNPEFVSLLRLAARNPALAKALANRLSLDPPWRSALFTVPAQARADEISGLTALLELHTENEIASRGDIKSLVSHLISAKRWDEAVRIDRLIANSSDENGSLLNDGNFGRVADDYVQNSTPFDWQTLNGAHAAGSIETAPPTRLVVDSDGEQSASAARRYMAIAPGRYALAFQSRADNPDSFQVKVACASAKSEANTAVIPQQGEFSEQSLRFEVTPICSVIQLSVETLPGGSPATAEFDDFELKRD